MGTRKKKREIIKKKLSDLSLYMSTRLTVRSQLAGRWCQENGLTGSQKVSFRFLCVCVLVRMRAMMTTNKTIGDNDEMMKG